MATLSRPVREHLRAIILTERARTSRVLALLRAVGALVNLVPTLWFGGVQKLPEWNAVLPVFSLYAVAALVLAVAVHRSPLLQRHTGLELGLLDIPVIGLAAAHNLPFLPDPSFLLGAYVPVLCLGIVLAALSLDFLAISVATASAAAVTIALVATMHANTEELFGPLLSTTFIGGATMYLVSRVRGLVSESRRKDFAGKYVLGERIGAGGMAEVFTATYAPEGGFERRVAVKRVLPSHSGNEEFVALFRREAELGARLAHPNLVQVLDFGKHLDSWFLAMEFVDGVSLASLIRGAASRGGAPVPLAASLYILAELAEGLTYLHEKATGTRGEVGMVHRDLNPPNVLLSRAGEVKISDFGVARWQTGEGLTGTGVIRGKLGYMPPEQLGGGQPGPQWDLFAFGVTAHELLCGKRLFVAETDAQMLRLVLEAPIAPPSDFRAEVPPEVDALVMQLVERGEGGRLRPSAREVSQRLRALEGPNFGLAQGRRELVDALAGLGPMALAQAPTSASGGGGDARTATIARPVSVGPPADQ